MRPKLKKQNDAIAARKAAILAEKERKHREKLKENRAKREGKV